MVAERKNLQGFLQARQMGLVQNLGPQPEFRPLEESGNVLNDIYRFSGLSDMEIAQALGVAVTKLLDPAFSQTIETRNSIARDFLKMNLRLADRRPLEKIPEWWREIRQGGTRLDFWVNNLSLRK